MSVRGASFRYQLARVVAMVEVPFGYTLTMGSATALAIDRFGAPHADGIFAFLVGGLAGYLAIVLAMAPIAATIAPAPSRRASLLNVVAIVAAIVVSGVTHLVVNPLLGFFVAGFTGTFAYITGLSAFNWLTSR